MANSQLLEVPEVGLDLGERKKELEDFLSRLLNLANSNIAASLVSIPAQIPNTQGPNPTHMGFLSEGFPGLQLAMPRSSGVGVAPEQIAKDTKTRHTRRRKIKHIGDNIDSNVIYDGPQILDRSRLEFGPGALASTNASPSCRDDSAQEKVSPSAQVFEVGSDNEEDSDDDGIEDIEQRGNNKRANIVVHGSQKMSRSSVHFGGGAMPEARQGNHKN